MTHRLQESFPENREPIAIIGMGCRYPGGADSPEDLWRLLEDGIDAITEIPKSRLDIDRYYDPSGGPGKIVTREGGFLENVDYFDPSFFNISPREAIYMDPQHRLLLEVTWEAFERAGLPASSLSGSQTGVFLGIWTNEYDAQMLAESDDIHYHVLIGGARYAAAGRISYAFNLQGPSLVVDTACSSSLVAIDLACKSLQSGESELALSGGVNLILEPDLFIGCSQTGMLSPEGRCKFGDASAQGYVRSEGAGIVVLKRLSEALRDHDPISAVILGSSVNSDGRAGTILTAPSMDQQIKAIQRACLNGGISPGEIGYVEAHGTGTPTGDPIELKALGSALGAKEKRERPLLVGSIKTNLGHTEAASGVAGLIKASLCVQHRRIPASLHMKDPNPAAPWSELSIEIPSQSVAWPENQVPAIAGVNSFGITGTNAHVIVAAPPLQIETPLIRKDVYPHALYLIPFSAHSAETLKALVKNHLSVIRTNSEDPDLLSNLAYTLSRRRTHMLHRLAVVVRDVRQLIEHLESFLAGQFAEGVSSASAQSDRPEGEGPVFVFSGMGPQWWAMGRDLLENDALFRKTIEDCDAYFQPLAGWSLVRELLSPEASSRMHHADVAQPAIFAIQVGLAAWLIAHGVRPSRIIGHSVGEVAAAYVSGALTLEDAITVSYHRSRLQQRCEGTGKMLAVGMGSTEANTYIQDLTERISIAAFNSPNSCTLSGDSAALNAIAERLEKNRSFVRFLQTEVPYHGPTMEFIREELLESLQGITPISPTIPIYSTALGKSIQEESFDAQYWWKNVRAPVKFVNGISGFLQEGMLTYLEISPHPVLSRSIQECMMHATVSGYTIPSLVREKKDRLQLLQSLGSLYTLGHEPDWSSIYSHGRCVSLPSYPFQRQRLWFDSNRLSMGAHRRKETRRGSGVKHPILGEHIVSASNPDMHIWSMQIDTKQIPFIGDHRFGHSIVFPAAAYVELALTAAKQVWQGRDSELESISFRKALILEEDNAREIQVVVITEDSKASYEVFSRTVDLDAPWIQHVSGFLRKVDRPTETPRMDIASLLAERGVRVSHDEHYNGMMTRLLSYGLAFRGVQEVWALPDGQALARICMPQEARIGKTGFEIHPVLLDAAFQAAITEGTLSGLLPEGEIFLPVAISRVRSYLSVEEGEIWSLIKLHHAEENGRPTTSIQLLSKTGEVLLEAHGLALQKTEPRMEQFVQKSMYYTNWQTQELDTSLESHKLEYDKWLVIMDDSSIGIELTRKLKELGCEVLQVLTSPSMGTTRADYFSVDLSTKKDLLDLFSSPQAQISRLGIVYLSSLDTQPSSNLSPEALLDCCGSMLRIMQKLLLQVPHGRLWIVTRGCRFVQTGDQVANHAQAALWGMGKVLSLEYPHLPCTCVDLDQASPKEDAERLFGEISHPHTDRLVAWRGGVRFVERLLRADSGLLNQDAAPVFGQATYLITGGLGGLGLEAANTLVNLGARNLVLIGRQGIKTKEQQIAVESLRERGCMVQIDACDISDLKSMTDLIERVKAELPPIRGIIHSAGVLSDAVFSHQNEEGFKRVMAPKTVGAWNLHRLTLEQPLDFFICYSSVSSTLGWPGQANYSASNSTLDAFADYRRALGLPALSINWGPWGEIGMAARGTLSLGVERGEQRWKSQGFTLIKPEEGSRALAALLAPPRAVTIGVYSINWYRYLAQGPQFDVPLLEMFREEVEESVDSSEVDMRTLYWATQLQDRPRVLLEHLKTLVTKILSLPPDRTVPTHRSLFDMGLDSLSALEVKNYLELNFQCQLEPTVLFDHPSLDSLVSFLLKIIKPPETSEGEQDGSEKYGKSMLLTPAQSESLLSHIEDLTETEMDHILAQIVQDGGIKND